MPIRRGHSHGLVFLIAGVWGVLTISGMIALARYSGASGENHQPPEKWPADSMIPLSKKGLTLVMFIHPRCPCTRSSVGELARIMADSGGVIDAHVMASLPPGEDASWARTDLWTSADAIPGVDVRLDVARAEAIRFHARTSGAVVVYDSDGKLVFFGGITPARGHAGDSAGRSAILGLAIRESGERHEAPVFGCPLMETGGCGERCDRSVERTVRH